jgi:hypothetical protein
MKYKFSNAAATWMLITTATVVTPAIAGSQAQTSSSFGTCEITSAQQDTNDRERFADGGNHLA